MEVSIEFLQKIALATFIGILIGIEREHWRPEGRELIAGVRTFTIACIAGMISAYLAQIVYPGILLISLAFFTMISVLYVYLKNVTLKQPGITSPIALYCTFLLGVLISYGMFLSAIVGAVVITLLLAEKRPLHSFATNLTDDEIRSAVRFLVVVFILYPIAPDELFMGVINPRWILLIVIMVATLSFISFIIMKKMGTRSGIPLSGLLGGMVSSQATTGALAAMAKKKNELVEPTYAGIIMANAAMRIMNLVTAFIVDPSGRVLLFMAAPQLIITSFAIIILIKSRNRINGPVSESIKLQSPFALSPAVKFAIGFAALSIILRFINLWAGTAGVYATALGGLISSDVVTASAAALAVRGNISYATAALTGVLASIISTVSTMILVKWAGPPELARMVHKTLIGFIIAGTIILIIWGIVITSH
jgi:uncharacterized membrane protein (DUF4010 family)